MLKEVKYLLYLIIIFLSLFFVINFYFSKNNIKSNNKIILEYRNQTYEKFDTLPLIINDTEDIIEYTNEIEEFKNEKERFFWKLLKNDKK